MKFRELNLPGVFEVELFHASDQRGSFVKTFHRDTFLLQGLEADFAESFYSTNHKGVIRGMHFQHPPHDHAKLVYVTQGRLLDVALDLRKNSPTFGRFATVEVSDERHNAVYMPAGVAHGFCCLTESTMIYLTSTQHHPDSDDGVRFDSFGMDWPVKNPIISERDLAFQTLDQLKSPF